MIENAPESKKGLCCYFSVLCYNKHCHIGIEFKPFHCNLLLNLLWCLCTFDKCLLSNA